MKEQGVPPTDPEFLKCSNILAAVQKQQRFKNQQQEFLKQQAQLQAQQGHTQQQNAADLNGVNGEYTCHHVGNSDDADTGS